MEGLEQEFYDSDQPAGQSPATDVIFNGQPGELKALGFRERNL